MCSGTVATSCSLLVHTDALLRRHQHQPHGSVDLPPPTPAASCKHVGSPFTDLPRVLFSITSKKLLSKVLSFRTRHQDQGVFVQGQGSYTNNWVQTLCQPDPRRNTDKGLMLDSLAGGVKHRTENCINVYGTQGQTCDGSLTPNESGTMTSSAQSGPSKSLPDGQSFVSEAMTWQKATSPAGSFSQRCQHVYFHFEKFCLYVSPDPDSHDQFQLQYGPESASGAPPAQLTSH